VRHNREDLVALKELVEAGKVTPLVDRSYELSEVPTLCSTRETDTPRERPSSPCEARPAAQITGSR